MSCNINITVKDEPHIKREPHIKMETPSPLVKQEPPEDTEVAMDASSLHGGHQAKKKIVIGPRKVIYVPDVPPAAHNARRPNRGTNRPQWQPRPQPRPHRSNHSFRAQAASNASALEELTAISARIEEMRAHTDVILAETALRQAEVSSRQAEALFTIANCMEIIVRSRAEEPRTSVNQNVTASETNET